MENVFRSPPPMPRRTTYRAKPRSYASKKPKYAARPAYTKRPARKYINKLGIKDQIYSQRTNLTFRVVGTLTNTRIISSGASESTDVQTGSTSGLGVNLLPIFLASANWN